MTVDKCINEINNELQFIDDLLNSHEILIKKLQSSDPDQIEISAIATVLHSFYNGIENIFKRIVNRIDNRLPSSNIWHQELLQQMAEKNEKRQEVISKELYEKLNLYLGFRHFFRHAYAFQFNWNKMKELIFPINKIYKQFKGEINYFISKLK